MAYFAGLMISLASIALMQRSVDPLINTKDQTDFLVAASTLPAMLELDIHVQDHRKMAVTVGLNCIVTESKLKTIHPIISIYFIHQ